MRAWGDSQDHTIVKCPLEYVTHFEGVGLFAALSDDGVSGNQSPTGDQRHSVTVIDSVTTGAGEEVVVLGCDSRPPEALLSSPRVTL